MSCQIIILNLFVELSEGEQELMSGGAEPQINNNNFGQRTGNTNSTNKTGILGNVSQINSQLADVNSGGQTVLSSDALGVSPMGSVNNFAPSQPFSSKIV
jgi:hypothetical protein